MPVTPAVPFDLGLERDQRAGEGGAGEDLEAVVAEAGDVDLSAVRRDRDRGGAGDRAGVGAVGVDVAEGEQAGRRVADEEGDRVVGGGRRIDMLAVERRGDGGGAVEAVDSAGAVRRAVPGR